MKIKWNKVSKYSQILAIIIYVGTFSVAFFLGQMWGTANAILDQSLVSESKQSSNNVINSATFNCDNEKTINAIFFSDSVGLSLSDGRGLILPQTISASGARYANEDESFIFWNKGDTAFVQEGNINTYDNCLISQ